MADLLTETIAVRQQIVSAANIYQQYLAGNVFLYVYGDKYFEVAYLTRCFKHLTGVESSLKAETFYDSAKSASLTPDQISFSVDHPLRKAKKKVRCLQHLHRLTCDLVCVVEGLVTPQVTYKLGLTNLEFTIGLNDNVDTNGNKINNWLVPRTLRVKDKSIEKSDDAHFIDFIFSKNVMEDAYSCLRYSDQDAQIPECIKPMLDNCFKREDI